MDHFAMVLMFLFIHTDPSASFLLDQCWVPECECSGNSVVWCSDRNLTKTPNFKPSRWYGDLSLSIDRNPMITSIHERAFEGLGQHVNGKLYLSLQSNRIQNIARDAFVSLEDKVKQLTLSNNSLTHIPSAIGTLRKLTSLDIASNPIVSLDPLVFSVIGPSLEYFSVSMSRFVSFPTEIRLLTNLTDISLEKVEFPITDRHAFSGQAHSLYVLEIRHSNLDYLPTAICDLSKLRTIIIQENNMTTLNNISNECSLPSVTHFHLWLNTITAIYDDDLPGFLHLQNLDLSRNPIGYISAGAFSHNAELSTLDLSGTKLHVLPVAITTLPNIQSIPISGVFNCSCSAMAGFKTWSQRFLTNTPYLVYGGSCDQSQSYIWIAEYMLKQLPKCP